MQVMFKQSLLKAVAMAVICLGHMSVKLCLVGNNIFTSLLLS